ncbi:hypothetical protein J2Y40_004457 [Chryseobacterium sp. 2987]|nr:hypothetical protein [Chryseobacterium sp. 2987]
MPPRKENKGNAEIQKGRNFPVNGRIRSKYHLYDPKLQTAEALSIRNRQVSWLAAASVILPAFGSGYAGTETFGMLLTVARQLVIFTRFPINLRYVKPLPF